MLECHFGRLSVPESDGDCWGTWFEFPIALSTEGGNVEWENIGFRG